MHFCKNNIDRGRVYYLRLFQMYLLHIILLTSDKIFLHVSNTNVNEEARILMECKIMYEYIHKYQPIRRLETVVLHQDTELDYYVKKYMKCYGIDNVRGGRYTDIELTNQDRQFIERELSMNIRTMQHKTNIMNTIFDEYSGSWTLEQLDKECNHWETQQTKYDNETQMLHNLTKWQHHIVTEKLFLTDLKWLMNRCIKNTIHSVGTKSTKEDMVKYKQILAKMKELYAIFRDYLDVDIKYEARIQLYAPEVVLDMFILHYNGECRREIYVEDLIKLLEYYEYIFYCVKCKADEYKFDISTYPPDFEIANKYRLTYLQQMIDMYSNDSRDTISCI